MSTLGLYYVDSRLKISAAWFDTVVWERGHWKLSLLVSL